MTDPSPNTTTVRRKRRRMPGLAVLPSMLTLGNALCGFAALVQLLKAFEAISSGPDQAVIDNLTLTCLWIGGGMVCDALDGKVARMTDSASEFGAQLDSLCDAITFGVVPAVLLRVTGEYFFVSLAIDTKLIWSVSGLYVVCAIMRLARFNVETDDDDAHNVFKGLPSPAAASSIAAMVLGLTWLQETFQVVDTEAGVWVMRFFIPSVGVVCGLAMVSRVRYVHLFNRLVSRNQSFRTMVVLVVLVTLFWLFSEFWKLMVPALLLAYVLSGPTYFIYRFIRGRGLLGRRMALRELKKQRSEREELRTNST